MALIFNLVFMKRNLLYLAIVLITVFSCGKEENPANKSFPNLDNRVITSIAVDKHNTKWIGTDAGLYKSTESGYSQENASNLQNILSLYYEKNTEILWVGTKSGLVKLNLANSNIVNTSVSSSDLSDNIIQTIYKDLSNRIWFGSSNGISMNLSDKWKKSKFYYNLLNELIEVEMEFMSINSISGWDGDLYFATNGYGIFRGFDYNATVDAFTGATGWEAPYNGANTTDTMFVVFVDSKGNQWMGGKSGVQVHTGHDPKLYFTYYNDELADSRIYAISEAPDGKIWIGTGKGISISNGSSWIKVTDKLPNLYVTAIAFDNDGSAWIGTKKGIVNIK
jgi:ligand-binding sensor domain-containing protein